KISASLKKSQNWRTRPCRWKQRSRVVSQQRSPANDGGRNPGRNAPRCEARYFKSAHKTVLWFRLRRLRHQGQRLSLFSIVLLQSGGRPAVGLGQRRDRHGARRRCFRRSNRRADFGQSQNALGTAASVDVRGGDSSRRRLLPVMESAALVKRCAVL